MEETILILDFGSQYTQLIARRVRELNVYCEIHPFHSIPGGWKKAKGIILSGSPYSVRDPESPRVDLRQLRGKMPLLGICYGAQLISLEGGGDVMASQVREYGRANLSYINKSNVLFAGMSQGTQVWMSHGDTIRSLPEGFEVLASTATVEVAGFSISGEATMGIQFHPEVYHSVEGMTLLRNFVVDICGCSRNWTPASFIGTTISDIRQKVGDDKVVMGLSGGVDSSVAATLIHKAIGKNLHCIFIDNGLLRKDEFSKVLDSYRHMDLNIKGVDASHRFLQPLKGVTNPESKRKIIGKVFIDVFDSEAHHIPEVRWLGQGTIYPDVIESVSVKGPSATIKSHHNVGGLPDYMRLKVLEPLSSLFKDEVRRVGEALGVDPDILNRHPFPGPGLGIRILGEVTPEKVALLQEVDHIFVEGLHTHGLYNKVWQALAVLLPVQSVGVMGDERTYESTICLRAVTSVDGMTADWARLPDDFLATISNEIINKIKGVNRVVYDISSKPPSTIEWE